MMWELDFSIGPVQGYVAQSRRTRDLWGSSYLLSYLSAQAMCGAAAANGETVRPRVAGDPLYQWVLGDRLGSPPRIGTVPNHFVVCTGADPREVADAATAAFDEAWRRVHEAVWDRFVQRVCHLGSGTEEIWQRQVDSCWEIMWVAGEAGQTAGLLDRRKRWRTHRLPDEPGDKCTVMPDFQELSGHVRAAGGAHAQDAFWDPVRAKVGALELRKDERLCAPALVKRLFARCDLQAIGGALEVDHWPSTLYVGAVPWLQQVRDRAAEQAGRYVDALRQVAVPMTIRRHIPVRELRDAEPADFFRLDANYYHRGFVATPRLCPLADDTARPGLMELLREVYRAVGAAPPVYYALLLADGDQVGRLVADAGTGAGAEAISGALSTFAGQVGSIVDEHHGVTAYAGGDDVLAMLPVASALVCADRLAAAYAAAFAPVPSRSATLSAAVLFAHVRVPIGGALEQAQWLLDKVAKEANGRDSLAAAVLKPGGLHCQWATSWTRTYRRGRQEPAVGQIERLTQSMTDEGAGRGFSASLLHHIRDTLDVLCEFRAAWKPGTTGVLLDGFDPREFVHAELVDSWDTRIDRDEPERTADLDKLADLVVELLAPSSGRDEDGNPVEVNTHRAGMDALLLARFLAGGGREEEHG